MVRRSATCLEATGHSVFREYYINDAGRQIDILAVSVYLRYLELTGENVAFPSNGYRAEYILPVARALHANAAMRSGVRQPRSRMAPRPMPRW
jgi:arginyl-tRNA synthetase